MNPGNISNLAFIAQTDPGFFKSALLDCKYAPWKDISEHDFRQNYQTVITCEKLHDTLTELFKLYLITKFLLDKNPPSWVGNFFSDTIDSSQYAGFSCKTLKKSRWLAVPVIFTGNNKAYIRFFVAGLLKFDAAQSVPEWTKNILDKSSLNAIETAIKTASSMSATDISDSKFFCYPLTSPGRTVQFRDSSLSLPLALGFKALLENQNISENLAATGVLETDGAITEVGNLKVKIAGIINSEFDGLIYPSSNRVNLQEQNSILIPVSDFKQAWMFFLLYSKKHKEKLLLLSDMLKNPRLFAENIGSMPVAWIEWIGQTDCGGSRIIYEVVKDPGLFHTFTNNFETAVEKFMLGHGRAISCLVNREMFKSAVCNAPVTAFRWCSASLSLANHLGRVGEAEKWQKRGETLLKDVLQADIDAAVTFFNHALISAHNRFSFKPDLPEKLKPLLAFLESQYENQCRFGCSVDLVLGRLYGTLMQNFAFCGPKYLEKAEAYSKKARKALGEGVSVEYQKEWTRQLNYITFARLDAEIFNKAEESLKRYLQINSIDEIFSQTAAFSPWQYSATVRFFAEIDDKSLKAEFYEWINSFFPEAVKNQHPWQLCAYNMGRIAYCTGHLDDAVKLFKKSIAICFSKSSGPTIQMMALLPISYLMVIDEGTGGVIAAVEDLALWKNNIMNACRNLDSSHFKFLKNSSFKKALKTVYKSPELVFPFTYR